MKIAVVFSIFLIFAMILRGGRSYLFYDRDIFSGFYCCVLTLSTGNGIRIFFNYKKINYCYPCEVITRSIS